MAVVIIQIASSAFTQSAKPKTSSQPTSRGPIRITSITPDTVTAGVNEITMVLANADPSQVKVQGDALCQETLDVKPASANSISFKVNVPASAAEMSCSGLVINLRDHSGARFSLEVKDVSEIMQRGVVAGKDVWDDNKVSIARLGKTWEVTFANAKRDTWHYAGMAPDGLSAMFKNAAGKTFSVTYISAHLAIEAGSCHMMGELRADSAQGMITTQSCPAERFTEWTAKITN